MKPLIVLGIALALGACAATPPAAAPGRVLSLETDALFGAGEATLRPEALRTLDDLARVLQREPEGDIVVQAFTDTVGPEDFNEALSERRARAVREALVARGVPAGRILARGLGEASPVASNATPAGRHLNRRIEIVRSGEHSASVGGTAP